MSQTCQLEAGTYSWLNTARLAKTATFRKIVERTNVVCVPKFVFPRNALAKRLGKSVVVTITLISKLRLSPRSYVSF